MASFGWWGMLGLKLSRKNVMRCLLVSEFHVDRALAVQIPPTTVTVPSPSAEAGNSLVSGEDGKAFPLPWYDSGSDDIEDNGHRLRTKLEFTEQFNLPLAMNALLKRNVAFIASDIRSKTSPELLSDSAQEGSRSRLGGMQKNDGLDDMTMIFQNLGLRFRPELWGAVSDKKNDEMQERKEWAMEMTMNVTRKVSSHHNEVRVLKMESEEEANRLRREIQAAEDATMKRHMEMQNSLRMISTEADHVHSISNLTETVKAEIKAETEAAKLSVSETMKSLREAERRDKKAQKKHAAAGKEKAKFMEEIAEVRWKEVAWRRGLAEIKRDIKEAEARWKQAKRERGVAEARLQEELHLKEVDIVNSRRRLEIVRMESNIELQRYKDERARLEKKLFCLKQDALNPPKVSYAPRLGEGISQREAIKAWADISVDRKCMMCHREVVSVALLLCGHEVICSTCDGSDENKGEAKCPCCGVPIEERIWVFGVGL